jgi:asparaginyl-tRNA synthetase
VQSVVKNRARELETARARRRQARKDRAAVSAHQLRRSMSSFAEGRQSGEVGRRFRRRRRNDSLKEFEKPVIIHRYPSAMKAFYMAPDPERPEFAL